MTKDTLRNEIGQLLDELTGKCVARGLVQKVDPKEIFSLTDETTSQILSLLEGSLPEDKVVEDLKGQIDYGYMQGWNACLEEIKEKLK